MKFITPLQSLLALTLVSLVAGCGATALKPGARGVLVTRQGAPEGCKYLGSVVGEQGGSVAGGLTSNRNLAVGALNDMKNEAHALGANYVVLEDSKAGATITGTKAGVSGAQTDVTNLGNAYHCPEQREREHEGTTTTTTVVAQAARN